MPTPDDQTLRLRIRGDRTVSLEVSEDRQFEAPICDDLLKQLAVTRLDRFVTTYSDSCERDDFRLLGAMLFDMLFGGCATEILRLYDGQERREPSKATLGAIFLSRFERFEEACAGTKADTACRFRLNLVFEEGSGGLARYPWEFLYVTRENDRGFFLAGQNTRLILTRIIPPLVVARGAPQDPVVLWIAWAQPGELGELLSIEDLASTIERKLKRGMRVEAHSFPDVTWQEFEDALERPPGGRLPDIIHFVGHGQIADGTSEMAFKRSPEEMDAARRQAGLHATVGEASWKPVADLGARLQGRAPWLFFLHSCNTGRAAATVEAFRSAAQQIARADVPFVIAMQYEIENADARVFAEEFYDKLGVGQSIDDAVKAGRSQLGNQSPAWGHRRFATPVVYLRGDAQVLVQRPPREAPPASAKQKCPYCAEKEGVDPDLKRCLCTKHLLLKYCPRGNPNQDDAKVCDWVGCNERFEVPGTYAQQPGAPASAPDGLGVA